MTVPRTPKIRPHKLYVKINLIFPYILLFPGFFNAKSLNFFDSI